MRNLVGLRTFVMVVLLFLAACGGTTVPEVVLTVPPTMTPFPTQPATETPDVAPTLETASTEYQLILGKIEALQLNIENLERGEVALTAEQQAAITQLTQLKAELDQLHQQLLLTKGEVVQGQANLALEGDQLTSVTELLIETQGKIDAANAIILNLEGELSAANTTINGLSLDLSAADTLARSMQPDLYHPTLAGFDQAIVKGHQSVTGAIPNLTIGRVAVAVGEEVSTCGLTFTVGVTEEGVVYIDPNLVYAIPYVKIVDRLSALTTEGIIKVPEAEIQGYVKSDVIEGASAPIQTFVILVVNSENDIFCEEQADGTLSVLLDNRSQDPGIDSANSQITFFQDLVCVITWGYNPNPTCQPVSTL